jgi:hypothetical protein
VLRGNGLLRRWLDASAYSTVTLTSGVVSTWVDRSGFARDISQATSGKRPAYIVGTSIDCSTTPQTGLDFGSGNMDDKTIVLCMTTPPANSEYRPIITDNGSGYVGLFEGGGDKLGSFAGGFFDTTYRIAVSTRFVCTFDCTSAHALSVGADGQALVATWSSGSAIPTGTLGYDGVSSRPGGSYHELVETTARLATWQRQTLEGYLAWKWNTVSRLAGSHPFKNRPPLIGD